MDEKTYEKFCVPYAYAMNLVMTHLKNAKSELFASQTVRNPIDNIYGRIKSLESINQKCKKEKYNLDPNDIDGIRQHIRDIAGIRITSAYRFDLERIKDYIDMIPGVFILEEKDYVKNPKPSGYQSLHLIVMIETCTLTKGVMKIPVEIQIRTLVMQSWAQVEHRARYKNDSSTSVELEEKLRSAAQLAAQLDGLYEDILMLSEPDDPRGPLKMR